MPATVAHPVAALPFARTRLVFSALVVGSMAPDFPYYGTLSVRPRFGHTFGGVFWFCVPVGLAVLLIFHRFVKRPIMAHLPAEHRQRLKPAADGFRLSSPVDWALTLASLAIGALTHLALDSCTHRYGWTVLHVPMLQAIVFQIGSRVLRVYYALQWGGSIVALAAILWLFLRWNGQPSGTRPGHDRGRDGVNRT